jgi:hypothetical protein
MHLNLFQRVDPLGASGGSEELAREFEPTV